MGLVRPPHFTDADWLIAGPIAPHAGAIKQHFANGGYAPVTVVSYLSNIAHFARWGRSKRLRLCRIDEAAVAEFLDEHLPHCRCVGPVRHDRCDHRAALGHLLFVLRAEGVIALRAKATTPVDEELQRFDAYMDRVRGLAPGTRTEVLRVVGRLLRQRFGGGCVDFASIKPAHVRRFYAQQATLHRTPGGAGSVAAALHSYFRYRASLADLVHGLIGAVSAPAKWRLATLPKALTAQEVEQLVASLGKPGRSMRRADAIVRCALDLGLRSGEVARLRLDDIDWQAGTITLRHTKGLREDVLPLPEATGEAIAMYLKNERPQTSNRSVFVRHIAPRDQPVGADLVRKTIRQAYARAGLPYTRSHLLRHTMASRLLAGGSSLKEVADVLRHRALSTTQIYAKLDSRKLVEVALPWPGSAS
jgi:site-specific recombinase XerD